MASLLCLSIRFIDSQPSFHGKKDGDEPEWPPSPLRLYQAIVCAAAKRWQSGQFQAIARPALAWLEEQECRSIISPKALIGTPYRIAVPNNDMDSPGSAWAVGKEPVKPHRPIDLKTMKTVHPIKLFDRKDNTGAVHYLFPLPHGTCPHFQTIQTAAHCVTHLGWGIDVATGDAKIISSDDVLELTGENDEQWHLIEGGEIDAYRVPRKGTLDALINRHEAFLTRISVDGFKPVSPLSSSAFRVVGYQRATEPSQRQFAAFTILKPDASGMRSFDTLRCTRDVAGMVRHAVAEVARSQGWAEERINVFVHGKTKEGASPSKGESCPDRFQYLPLPTINPKRVESIRRVLISAPPHCGSEITWVRRAMAGAELVNHNAPVALLTILPRNDGVLQNYIGESNSWSTVTPVILPGYDDPGHLRRKLKNGCDAETQKRYLARLDARIEYLLRKSLRQAGYSEELVKETKIEWRNVGFRAGVELASRYLPPENLSNSPRLHVKLRFPNAIRGPIAIGSGRFRGFGLFAADKD